MSPFVMLIIAALLLIGAVLREVDWRKHALNWVGYNPARAKIVVIRGNNLKVYEGFQHKTHGEIYGWKDKKDTHQVTLPANYPHENLNGYRVIGVVDGLPVASPFGYMSDEQVKACVETAKEVEAIVQSDIVVKVLKSISQSKPINWMTVIIVGAVLVAGVYWYSTQNKQTPPVNPVTNNPAQTNPASSDNIILVIPPVKVTP